MNFRILTIVFFAVTLSVYGCNKAKYADTVAPSDDNPPLVNTIDATADTINIYQSGIRQNSASNIYPGGSTSYLYFLRGTQNISVKKAGSSAVLFSNTFPIDSSQYYSLFVTGTVTGDMFITNDAIDTAQSVLENDETSTLAMVRFVNASPQSGALAMTIDAGDTVNFKNINYTGATAFVPLNATVTEFVKVFTASNNTTPAVIDTLTLQPDYIYTLYTRGSLTGTGKNALNISVAVDPYIIPR